MEFKYICLVNLIKFTLGLIVFLCKMKTEQNLYCIHKNAYEQYGFWSSASSPLLGAAATESREA